jgi:hypothetical protein
MIHAPLTISRFSCWNEVQYLSQPDSTRKTYLRAVTAWAALAALGLAISAADTAAAGPTSAAPTLRLADGIPSRIALHGRYDEFRVLVDKQAPSGRIDASGEAKFDVADPAIATVDANGTVRPLKDGATSLLITAAKRKAQVGITVTGVSAGQPPRFTTDVSPILTRAGCNMGACHGAGSGKGGFKLSLQGYDPELDYAAIVRAVGGRRIIRTQPDQSLILRKATLRVVHKGGQRFRVGSPEYRIIRDWIATGAPGPSPKDPHVLKLRITPPLRTLQAGQKQRYAVRAVYGDGTQRDVTSQTLFTASDETVATVTPEGEATATGPGEGAVLCRYQGLVLTARLVSPFAPPILATTPQKASTSAAQIDRLVQTKLDALGLVPSPLCTDSDFVRRVYLDVTGLLPSPEAAAAFIRDRDPQKREKLIDRLLASGEYVDFWTLKWGDLLRSSRKLLSDKGMAEYNFWIRRCVAENVGWDRVARDILVAQGNPDGSGPANFFRTTAAANELAEATSQTFLGVRIQCARCHNHPYEKWTQNQYYEMAAFFAKVHVRKASEAESVVAAGRGGDVRHPKTSAVVQPCALDDKPVPADYLGDRRSALAEWLTSPQNPFFATCVTNRLWKHFMGRGLVEPVDDLRVTNPPSNADLFDFLGRDLAAHGFDLKHTMRAILLSRVYQRSAIPTAKNARDTRYYSHYLFKRLSAEQLMDAIASATGVPEKFPGYPLGVRASQLPDTTVPSYFLELFGRPARNITCACERTDDPNLGQVLHLMNNAGINTRLAAPTGRVRQLLNTSLTTDTMVRDLYLTAYSRPPSATELRLAVQDIESTGRPAPQKQPLYSPGSWIPARDLFAAARRHREKVEDLLWALMNTKEFVFNH